jgi:hypothetical protein
MLIKVPPAVVRNNTQRSEKIRSNPRIRLEFVCSSSDVTVDKILSLLIQLQKSLQYTMYYYCNVLYCSEFYVLVYRLPEDGGVPPKHVAVNKILCCCVC